jgi:hypothetical protein
VANSLFFEYGHMLRLATSTLLVLITIVAPVSAFQITGYQWPQSQLGAPVTITYSFSNLLDGGLVDPNNQPVQFGIIRESIEEAFGLWASVAPLNFVEVPDSGPPVSDLSYTTAPGMPEIRLGHHNIDGFGNVKGHAYYPYSTTDGLAGDVHFDDLDRWVVVGTLTFPDLLGCAEHEIGHALGLDHSGFPTSIMYPTFVRMNGPGTGYLTADDIAGIQSIYGAGHGSGTPLPEPSTIALAALGLGVLLAAPRFSRRAK